MLWQTARFHLDLTHARVMGIVNVTPDSFSDGGHHASVDAAVAHGLKLAEEGADLLDVGGESTRPGATPVSLEEGQRLLLSGNYLAARSIFEQVVEADARNAAAVVGLAACQLGLGEVDGALKSLESVKVSTRPDVHLWTAYAHLRDRSRARARESLRKAMDLGWAPGNRPAEAVPEAALRDDIEALLQQRNRKRTSGRESLGSGSSSP